MTKNKIDENDDVASFRYDFFFLQIFGFVDENDDVVSFEPIFCKFLGLLIFSRDGRNIFVGKIIIQTLIPTA